LNDPKAMKYLEQRKCFHPEAVKLFRMGYANRTLGYRVPSTTVEGRKLKAQLQRLGILRESGHEHMTGSVVFPIVHCSADGPTDHIVQMYGRKITPGLREGTPLHLYLPGEHKAVWNAAALRRQKEWLLCEALLDALTLWCAGYRNVTCAYGVNGFTPAHWQLLDDLKPERIVLCYDNDQAGNTAADKLTEQLSAKGVCVLRAKLPPGKDVNDVARENKNAQAALATVLEGSGSRPITARPIARPTPAPPLPAEPSPVAAAPPKPPAESTLVKEQPVHAAAKEEEKPAPLPAPAPSSSLAAPSVAPAKPEAPEEGPASGDEANFTFGCEPHGPPRQWRVRGIGKNLSFETLRVQLRVMHANSYHLDTLDLCNAKHRQSFLAQAHGETGLAADVLKRDLGQVLLKVEELQEQHIRKTVEPERKESCSKTTSARPRWRCSAIPNCSTAFFATSSVAPWWASRPTN
jgi:hypothetical protein